MPVGEYLSLGQRYWYWLVLGALSGALLGGFVSLVPRAAPSVNYEARVEAIPFSPQGFKAFQQALAVSEYPRLQNVAVLDILSEYPDVQTVARYSEA